MRTIRQLFLILIVAMCYTSHAQEEMTFEHGCNFKSDKIKGEYTLFEPTKEAGVVVDTILVKLAIRDRPFILKAADVENAQATLRGRSRYLLYSNQFLKQFTSDARTKWAAYAIFAHEIGHHVLGHDLEDTLASNRRKFELQADAWAARILARMGASREDALAAVNALTDDNSRYYPKKSARLESMGIAYDEEKAGLDKTTSSANAANKTSISIDPKSFNQWSVVKKENVKATIDDDKIVIELNNISDFYRERTLYIKLSSNDGNMRVTKVEGVGENLKFETTKKIVWHYNEDEVPKVTASSAEKLRIAVYSMNNKPQKASGVPLAMASAGVGLGIAIYSFSLRSQALKDHTIYKSKTNENDAAYSVVKREDLYDNANSTYKKSQVFLGIGSVLAVLGTSWWIKKASINRQAKEAGFAYFHEKKKWTVEPLIASNAGIGVLVKF